MFEYIVLKYYLLESDRSGGDNYDKACQGSTGQEKHDPPLLFDLNVDPGERFPISNNTEAYGSVKLLWNFDVSYHFAGKIDTAVFNQLQAEHMEYLKELDELDNS